MASRNLILNSDMEAGNRWDTNGATTGGYAISPTEGYDSSARFWSMAGDSGAFLPVRSHYCEDGEAEGHTRFRVRPGQVVTLTVKLNRLAGDQTCRMGVQFYSKTNVYLGVGYTNACVSTAVYEALSGDITVPVDAYEAEVFFEIQDGSVWSYCRFDNATFTRPNAIWPYELPNPDYGWNEGDVEGMIIRSDTDAGVAKQRLRYTAVATPVTATLTLSPAQIDIFKAFVRDELKYVLAFDWMDMLNDTDILTYRMTKKPTYTRVNFGQIQVGLSMELLP
jgi:hypothetical protein